MEFRSWGSSGKYLGMEKDKGVGFSIGNSLTAGESYEEYSFVEEDPITCVQHLYTYEAAPEDDWPGKTGKVRLYHFYASVYIPFIFTYPLPLICQCCSTMSLLHVPDSHMQGATLQFKVCKFAHVYVLKYSSLLQLT